MDDTAGSLSFYEALPKRTSFAELTDPAAYVPLPDDWVIGVSDIVGSTRAVAAGRYKTVNMIGAAVISAQINSAARIKSAKQRDFPFVFGGDGAGFACPPDRAAEAGAALAAVRCWAAEEFDMGLRVAMVPVCAIRAAAPDVRVARYQPSPGVDYAMFTGGGLSWAETRMKAGGFAIPKSAPGTIPGLTFEAQATHGTVPLAGHRRKLLWLPC